MLIIFDLDDTLVDTSGCITPIKLEDALHQLVGNGFEITDFSIALEQLKRIDAGADSAKDAIAEFLEIHSADKKYFNLAVKEIYENISPELPLFAFDGVHEILQQLSQAHHLALVTNGIPAHQHWKLKKTGIDSAIFSKIAVCEEGSKKIHYQQIVEELHFSPSEVVVCGDRVTRDLTPAKDLGFRTIHLRKGRGRKNPGMTSDVDYSINEFIEIPQVLLNFLSP